MKSTRAAVVQPDGGADGRKGKGNPGRFGGKRHIGVGGHGNVMAEQVIGRGIMQQEIFSGQADGAGHRRVDGLMEGAGPDAQQRQVALLQRAQRAVGQRANIEQQIGAEAAALGQVGDQLAGDLKCRSQAAYPQ